MVARDVALNQEETALSADASAEFDPHARSYREMVNATVRFADETVDDFARQKVALMLDSVARLLGDPSTLSMLDVGCGLGMAERILAPRVGRIVAGDVSLAMLDEARHHAPEAEFVHLSGQGLPFASDAFDVQFCYCVHHHIPPADRRAVFAELARVVRPGGLVFVFEHNPWNPVTRAIVRDCPLDRDAVLLTAPETRALLTGAGLEVAEQRYYLFFPRVLGFLRRFEPWLAWLPLGGQYYVAARKPR